MKARQSLYDEPSQARGESQGKKAMQPKLGYACKYCGGNDHYSIACFDRPRKPIAQESGLRKAKRLRTRKRWFQKNRPDDNGQWPCYLQISPDCAKMVDKHTISLEHVRSKARSPKLTFRTENIKAACEACNKLKMSWSVQDLAETYPQIAIMIATPDWVQYEKQLDALEASLW